MHREFTSSIYIVDQQKILLILHKKLGKWLPPGGHLDPNELPSEAAVREAKEETGLDVEIIPQENIWIPPIINARSFPRPYLCLLEEIPEHNTTPAHQHIDLVYIGKVIGGTIMCNTNECDKIRWFSIEDLSQEEDLFEDTRQAARHILIQVDRNQAQVMRRFDDSSILASAGKHRNG